MVQLYNPLNWYWIVGGTGNHIAEPGDSFTGDDSRVFSSARNGYVSATDATYVAWRDAGQAENGIDRTTRIDSEDNLAAVLLPYGIAVEPPLDGMAASGAVDTAPPLA